MCPLNDWTNVHLTYFSKLYFTPDLAGSTEDNVTPECLRARVEYPGPDEDGLRTLGYRLLCPDRTTLVIKVPFKNAYIDFACPWRPRLEYGLGHFPNFQGHLLSPHHFLFTSSTVLKNIFKNACVGTEGSGGFISFWRSMSSACLLLNSTQSLLKDVLWRSPWPYRSPAKVWYLS